MKDNQHFASRRDSILFYQILKIGVSLSASIGFEKTI